MGHGRRSKGNGTGAGAGVRETGRGWTEVRERGQVPQLALVAIVNFLLVLVSFRLSSAKGDFSELPTWSSSAAPVKGDEKLKSGWGNCLPAALAP